MQQIIVFLFLFFITSCEPAQLPPGQHSDLVAKHCTGCHGVEALLIKKRSRQQWEKVLTWMQKVNGMPPIEASDRQKILDYLEKI